MPKLAVFAMLGGVASATGGVKEIKERLDVLEGFMSRMNDHVVEVSSEAGGGIQFLTQVEFKSDLLVSGKVNFEGFPPDRDVLSVIQEILVRLNAIESTETVTAESETKDTEAAAKETPEDETVTDEDIEAITAKYTGNEHAFGGGR